MVFREEGTLNLCIPSETHCPFIRAKVLSSNNHNKELKRIILPLKQHRRRRIRKRHLKSDAALPQTLSRLFHRVQFVKCWQFVLEMNSKTLSKFKKRKKKQKQKQKTVGSCSCRPQNVKLGIFTSYLLSRAVTANKCSR